MRLTPPTGLGPDSAPGPAVSFYLRNREVVADAIAGSVEQVRLKKGTASNLFRYSRREHQATRAISLKKFNHVLGLDSVRQTLDVEGLATYETIVPYCLAAGFLPTVVPELKPITIAGATVGIGIESSCYRSGFVHDGLIEADVLLPDGRIVTCREDNEYADLFDALPNSYGTLGYILRVTIRLCTAKPYVQIQNIRFSNLGAYLDAIEEATIKGEHDYIEGLFYSEEEQYLTLSRQTHDAPYVDDIYGSRIYYKSLRSREEMFLKTEDYLFRYDPDWFWNVPETRIYMLYRRLAPKRFRNSGFYSRYVSYTRELRKLLRLESAHSTEPLIQDWQVPWKQAKAFAAFVLADMDIQGRPWTALPIKTPTSPTLYPLDANRLYINVGCYCHVRRAHAGEDYAYTKLIDRRCFELGGLKMLYSSTFLSRAEFDRLYNGEAYRALKRKYDPTNKTQTLFEKAVEGH